MEQYSQFYKFGKHGRVGGGNPIRDTEGNITAEYGAFNAQTETFMDNTYQTKSDGYSPTRNEAIHMRPTNNFEEITEVEFDRREQAKAQYRLELQQQMQEINDAKNDQKKKEVLKDIEHEQRIYKQLQDMRQEFIKEEVKKGNNDVKSKAPKIDMLPPLSKEEALNMISKKERDRSRSKSKSPDARNYGSDRKGGISRLDLHQETDS